MGVQWEEGGFKPTLYMYAIIEITDYNYIICIVIENKCVKSTPVLAVHCATAMRASVDIKKDQSTLTRFLCNGLL